MQPLKSEIQFGSQMQDRTFHSDGGELATVTEGSSKRGKRNKKDGETGKRRARTVSSRTEAVRRTKKPERERGNEGEGITERAAEVDIRKKQ